MCLVINQFLIDISFISYQEIHEKSLDRSHPAYKSQEETMWHGREDTSRKYLLNVGTIYSVSPSVGSGLAENSPRGSPRDLRLFPGGKRWLVIWYSSQVHQQQRENSAWKHTATCMHWFEMHVADTSRSTLYWFQCLSNGITGCSSGERGRWWCMVRGWRWSNSTIDTVGENFREKSMH